MSIHISASLPQWLQVPWAFTFFSAFSCAPAGAAFAASTSSRLQVNIISASFPQFTHLQTSFREISPILDSFGYAVGLMIPPSGTMISNHWKNVRVEE
jgi:hypothetical protein